MFLQPLIVSFPLRLSHKTLTTALLFLRVYSTNGLYQ